VDNSVEVEEQRILDTYEPTLYESDSDSDNVPDVPVISDKAALEELEHLRLLRLPNPDVNLPKGEQLEGHLYREKRNNECLRGMARRRQHQPAITGCHPPTRIFLSFCLYILL